MHELLKSCIGKRPILHVKQTKDFRDRMYKNHWYGFQLYTATNLEETTSSEFWYSVDEEYVQLSEDY